MVVDESVTVFMLIKTEYTNGGNNADTANIKITKAIQDIVDKYDSKITLKGAIVEFDDDSILKCDDGLIGESNDDPFDIVISLTANNEDALDAIAEKICMIELELSTGKVTKITKAKKKKGEIGFQDLP